MSGFVSSSVTSKNYLSNRVSLQNLHEIIDEMFSEDESLQKFINNISVSYRRPDFSTSWHQNISYSDDDLANIHYMCASNKYFTAINFINLTYENIVNIAYINSNAYDRILKLYSSKFIYNDSSFRTKCVNIDSNVKVKSNLLNGFSDV